MSWTRRIANLFRQRRLNQELDEEMASHIEEAIEQGRDPEEVRRAFGSTLLHREQSRDIKLAPWLDSLISDAGFGWRQLRKRPAVSAAAILSLALAIGAITAAFRLINAVLLRTLPVAEPDRLFVAAMTYVDRDGHADYRDDFDYPSFRRYREVVGERADLIVAGMAGSRGTVVLGSATERETAYQQYVSGNLFPLSDCGRLWDAFSRRMTTDPAGIP